MDFKPLQINKKRNPKFKKTKRILTKLTPLLIVTGILVSLAFYLITRSGASSFVVNTILSGTSLQSTDGRINVLLLGIAGGQHDGRNLTDTIMVASYNLKTNNVYLLSVPRDLWLPSLKSKANAVYEIGLRQDNGLNLAKTVIGNVVGVPIHYALRVDFRGFVKAIDSLGGIEVEVEKPFDDYLYPIQGAENDLCGNVEQELDLNEEEAKKLNIEPGKRKVLITADGTIATDSAEENKGMKYFSCRYEHIKFTKGKTKMSGAVALAFARSRHGTNGEGSDFARAKRQQKVIEAAKNKALSLETLANPKMITDLIKELGQSVDTDISIKDAIEFIKLSKKLNQTNNLVIDNSPISGLPDGRKSLLVNPPSGTYGGAYVLVSQDDDFSFVHQYINEIFAREAINEASASSRSRNAGF